MGEKKAVVLFSGGLDSTTLLYYVLSQKFFDVMGFSVSPDQVLALSVFYGQRHNKELECAKKITELLKVQHLILELPQLQEILTSSALIDTSKVLPNEHYTHENQKATVVPNRNMILVSIAGACAENYGATHVFYAAHKNDYAIYPDCRYEWVRSVSKTLSLGTYGGVKVYAPFIDLYKSDLVLLGKELNIPYELTWSCYKGEDIPCSYEGAADFKDTLGKGCATCQERNEAFFVNNLQDPLYLHLKERKT